MPPPTAAQLALIKRFEPILFFHSGERFFPSDAKRYLENCALTQGAAPVIAAGKLAAIAGEAQAPGDFLGRKLPNGKFEFLDDTPANKDVFLDLAGWKAETTELPGPKRFANLDAIAARYANATDPLNASQFWYHAEVFDKAKITSLFADDVAKGGKDLGKLITTPEEAGKLANPILICYYLFFPGHDEGLPGCEGVAVAQEFASYAGEWGCVAVLLDGPGPNGPFTPRFAGLSMRNVGVPVREDGEEVRVGMRIFSWNALELEPITEHPRLVVAKGSHGLYLPSEPPGVVKAFTPDDPGRNSCGLAAPVAAAMDGTENVTAPPFLMPPGETVTKVTKILAAMAGGALIGLVGGAVGAVLGAIGGLLVGAGWMAAETQPFKSSSGTSPTPPPVPGPVTDTVPSTAPGPAAGKVAHPPGLVPSGVAPDRSQPWRSEKVTLAGRAYDFAVDRDAQILWTGDPDPLRPGFPGRWGPITEDYNTLIIPPIPSPAPRRSGMRFPKFWRMFFSELVLSNPAIPTKQYLIDRAEGTPIGNATSGGGLAAAYDGDTGQIFTASPFSNATPAVFNGKRFPTPYRISGIRLWLTSDFGLNNNTGAMRVCTVYGKSGADPANPTDGTQVFTFTVTDTTGASFSFLTGFNTAVAYDRIWVAVANSGTNIAVFSEIEWYQDSV